MRAIWKKIFEPNKYIGFFLINLSIVLLIYVFACHLEDTWLAYVSYPLSTYALIVFCVWFYKACRFSNQFIKKNSKLYQWYHQKEHTLTKIFLLFSLSLNFVYGIFRLWTGIFYKSEWFITFAFYYLFLFFMKALLILSVKKEKFGKNLAKEDQKLKLVGITLLILDIVLSGMTILILHQKKAITYPGSLIYAVAIYDFYLIITAFINVFKYRHQSSLILTASKFINLTVAMISMLSLEASMIYRFGNEDEAFRQTMIACTGFVIVLINSILAIYMILKVHKNLKIRHIL